VVAEAEARTTHNGLRVKVEKLVATAVETELLDKVVIFLVALEHLILVVVVEAEPSMVQAAQEAEQVAQVL
jgi:hypothetical protein